MPKILDVQASPSSGYAGDQFTITVKVDTPLPSSLYYADGQGKWQLLTTFPSNHTTEGSAYSYTQTITVSEPGLKANNYSRQFKVVIRNLLGSSEKIFSIPVKPKSGPEIVKPQNDDFTTLGNIEVKWTDVGWTTSYIIRMRDITDTSDDPEGILVYSSQIVNNATTFTIPSNKLNKKHRYRLAVGAQFPAAGAGAAAIEPLWSDPIYINIKGNSSLDIIDLPEKLDLFPGQKVQYKGIVYSDKTMDTIKLEIKRQNSDFSTTLTSSVRKNSFNLSRWNFEATGENQSVPGKYDVIVSVKFTGDTAYQVAGDFVVEVLTPVFSTSTYLYNSDEIYVTGTVNKAIGLQNENNSPQKVWVQVYNEYQNKWEKLNDNILNPPPGEWFRLNYYEKYIPAVYLPRDTKLKFMVLLEGHDVSPAIKNTVLPELIIPKETWITNNSEYFNVKDDQITVGASLKRNLPRNYKMQLVISGTGSGLAYYDIQNINGTYKKNFSLADLKMQPGKTYDLGIRIIGYGMLVDETGKTSRTISKPDLTTIKLSQDNIVMECDSNFIIYASVTPQNFAGIQFEWISSDENVAKITRLVGPVDPSNSSVNIHCINKGTATITTRIKNTNIVATCIVKVYDTWIKPIKPIWIDKNGNPTIDGIETINKIERSTDKKSWKSFFKDYAKEEVKNLIINKIYSIWAGPISIPIEMAKDGVEEAFKYGVIIWADKYFDMTYTERTLTRFRLLDESFNNDLNLQSNNNYSYTKLNGNKYVIEELRTIDFVAKDKTSGVVYSFPNIMSSCWACKPSNLNSGPSAYRYTTPWAPGVYSQDLIFSDYVNNITGW